MKSQVLHTVWCNISGEAAGEIWNWSLLGVKKVKTFKNALILPHSGVALMQIFAYCTHTNLAVREIMEALPTAYAQKGDSVDFR